MVFSVLSFLSYGFDSVLIGCRKPVYIYRYHIKTNKLTVRFANNTNYYVISACDYLFVIPTKYRKSLDVINYKKYFYILFKEPNKLMWKNSLC